MEARIEGARDLLPYYGYSISRIAELPGYHVAGFLSRQFRNKARRESGKNDRLKTVLKKFRNSHQDTEYMLATNENDPIR